MPENAIRLPPVYQIVTPWPNASNPQYVVPIHDWYLEEHGKEWLYGSVERVLAEEEITLLRLDDFETVTVDVD